MREGGLCPTNTKAPHYCSLNTCYSLHMEASNAPAPSDLLPLEHWTQEDPKVYLTATNHPLYNNYPQYTSHMPFTPPLQPGTQSHSDPTEYRLKSRCHTREQGSGMQHMHVSPRHPDLIPLPLYATTDSKTPAMHTSLQRKEAMRREAMRLRLRHTAHQYPSYALK